MLVKRQGRNLATDPSLAIESRTSATDKLFNLIREGDPRATHAVRRHLRFLVTRQLGVNTAESLTEEILGIAVGAIKRRQVVTNHELLATTRKLTRAALGSGTKLSGAATLSGRVPTDIAPIDALLIELRKLPQRDRDALKRFYLDGWTSERISVECGLTQTEFSRVRIRMRQVYDLTVTPVKRKSEYS